MSNTKTIAKNAGWYGLENIISAVIGMFTSIVIARDLGPSKLGYLVYVMWIASVVSNLGGLGIPSTTSKYMAEFLGKGDRGTARYIYFRTLMLQILMASLATIGVLFWVLKDADTGYKLAAGFIVLSIWPSMVNTISAMANVATEELSRNLPASVISTIVYFAAIAATVLFHWGVVGVGASYFVSRSVDFLVRLFPTMKYVLSWETTHIQPHGLAKRMMTFAWQSVATMVVALIVWNRSEVVLLKYLCSDIRQVAFYSVAFGMADRLLLGASVFGSATSTTIFAQYGRDRSRLAHITASAFRYLALTTIPLHFIATGLAAPALLLLYGNKYRDAALVVTLAPVLCMFKAFMGPVQSLLQSAERQVYVIWATVIAGVVDMGVAWLLIPAHGAVGACIGSGAAQILAFGIMWAVGIRFFKVKLPWILVAKVTFISLLASLAGHYVALRFAPLWAIVWGGSASLAVLFTLFYFMRVLEPEDRRRFGVLATILPKPMAAPFRRLGAILVRPVMVSAETDENLALKP
jgi:O-antigen/teichoic acid export membrane protein